MDTGAWIALLILGIVIDLAIAYWVYRDANARGRSGVLWGMLALILPLVTLIIWLITRPKRMALR
jgi:hypothetical protein